MNSLFLAMKAKLYSKLIELIIFHIAYILTKHVLIIEI